MTRVPPQRNSPPRSCARPSLNFLPVFLGSAVKNTAVQLLLDGVCAYLASTSERHVVTYDTAQPAGSPQVELVPASVALLVALAFKLEEGRFGQLAYMRVYQGCLKKGRFIFHGRSGKRIKVPKLVCMHSNKMKVRTCECSTVLVLMTGVILGY